MKIYRLPSGAPFNGVGFGVTDLLYIQEGVNEAVASIVSSQLPAGYNLPVVMNGCVVAKTGTTYTHTAGQIYWNGLIYTVDALTSPLSSPSGEAKWVGVEVKDDDNNVVFDNGVDYPIDIHLKFVLVASTEAGEAQWDQVRRLEHIVFNKSRELYEIITIPKLPPNDFFASYFNANGVGFPYKKYEGFEIATGAVNSVDMAGKTTLGINFRDTSEANVRLKSTDGGATAQNTYFPIGLGVSWLTLIGSWVGKWNHKLTAQESGLPSHTHRYRLDSSIVDRGAGSGHDVRLANDAEGNTPNWDTESASKDADLAHENRQPSVVSIIIQKVSEITY